MSLIELLQIIGTPIAVYVGIRMDMAVMKTRLDHIERDLYKHKRETA